MTIGLRELHFPRPRGTMWVTIWLVGGQLLLLPSYGALLAIGELGLDKDSLQAPVMEMAARYVPAFDLVRSQLVAQGYDHKVAPFSYLLLAGWVLMLPGLVWIVMDVVFFNWRAWGAIFYLASKRERLFCSLAGLGIAIVGVGFLYSGYGLIGGSPTSFHRTSLGLPLLGVVFSGMIFLFAGGLAAAMSFRLRGHSARSVHREAVKMMDPNRGA